MSFLRSLEIYNDEVPRSAPTNMALDEVFWQSATAPRLRFYRWDHPALSFGYFGEYAEVAQFAGERETVRRCTGGGIVFHGDDLTYALIIPASELGHGQSSIAIYSQVHEAIRNALHHCDIDAVLVEQSNCSRIALRNAAAGSNNALGRVAGTATATENVGDQHSSNACFANPVAADVLVEGRKVAGAAQRRSRRGLLQQGSIQNIHLPSDFQEQFTRSLSGHTTVREINSSILNEAGQLAESKYATDRWLRQR